MYFDKDKLNKIQQMAYDLIAFGMYLFALKFEFHILNNNENTTSNTFHRCIVTHFKNEITDYLNGLWWKL